MIRFLSLLTVTALTLVGAAACSTAPASAWDKAGLEHNAAHAVSLAQANDPGLDHLLRHSAGYAVFPNIGKGAAGIGGAYGKGVLYQNGVVVGYCDLSQATIGVQLGGQAYTEIVCFETIDDVNRFKQGNFAFDAQASAVALKSGTSANAKYTNGVYILTTDEAGLMYEASVGGQKFSYERV